MMGGGIKGGIIHGKYPTDFSENGDLNIGRGRLIPTLPNEAPWQAVAQWMGVEDSKDLLDYILPNRKSFDACSLFTDEQLFHAGSIETSCGKVTEGEDDNNNDEDGNAGNDGNGGNGGNDDFSGNVNGDHNNDYVNDNANDNDSNNNATDNNSDKASGSTTISLRLFAIAGSMTIALVFFASLP